MYKVKMFIQDTYPKTVTRYEDWITSVNEHNKGGVNGDKIEIISITHSSALIDGTTERYYLTVTYKQGN